MKQQNVKQMYFYKNYLMIFPLPLFDLMSKFCSCSLGTGDREEMMNISKKTKQKKQQNKPKTGFACDFQISFIGLGG